MPDSAHQDQTRARLRRAAYLLLILTAVGDMTGRVFSVQSRDGETPFLSANDRSRWSTIRALVDEGTYQLDGVILQPSGRFDKRWHSIDLVRHKGWDGLEHYYSSKPPLLPTLLAGQYWLVKQSLGITLAEEPFYIARLMLLLNNVLPLAVFFVLLARWLERYGTTDWGRIFVMACAAWGTFLTSFAVTLNNHLPAALSVFFAVYAAAPIWLGESRRWSLFALSGFFAAFAAANELPALAFACVLGAGLLYKAPVRTLLAFAPAAALVAAGFFYTNYLAHGSWRPPYAHRGEGEFLAAAPVSLAKELNAGRIPEELREQAAEAGVELSPGAVVARTTPDRRWVLWDRHGADRLAVLKEKDRLAIHAWDNWYDYDRSYWITERSGVDRGEACRGVYAFHVLIGHHGLFSLTPIWLLSVLGVGLMWRRRHLRGLAIMTLALTFVVLVFYISRPQIDRNYGGVTNGLRWLFWLIPLWLLCLAPAADLLSRRRWGRWLACVLLLVSVVSASYTPLNPWSHPWLFDYWTYIGWIDYS